MINQFSVDAAGNVTGYDAKVALSTVARPRPSITEEDAIRLATAELAKKLGVAVKETTVLTSPQLVYLLEDRGTKLRLAFKFDLRFNGDISTDTRVLVDATNRRVELFELRSNAA